MTFLAGHYSTAVFGEHDPTRPLVGLLFDLDSKKNCKIKDMYLSDAGTYKRGWVGTMEEVKKFQNAHKNKRFGDINAFKEALKNQPYALNEMLVKATRESISAIVIANDTPEARRIARQRQADLNTQLKIYVPIVFYNRMLRKVTEYTSEQIQEERWLDKIDGINANPLLMKKRTILKELESRNNLIQLKKELKEKLSKKTSRPAWKTFFSSDPDEVLLKAIEVREAMQSKSSADVIIWSDLEEKVKLQLQQQAVPPASSDEKRNLPKSLGH